MDLDTLRRTLLQRLESDRRFGLTHLPKPQGAFDLSFLRDVGEGLESDEAGAAVSVAARNVAIAPQPVATPSSAGLFDLPAAVVPVGENIAPPNTERSEASRADRVSTLKVLSERVAGCVRCGELAATRTQTVFGVGNPEAAIFFLGEAPGADEDRIGEPFVGRAGQLLDKIIGACRLTRDDIYIGNILKCRPPGNRNPAPIEAANCREYLSAQIATVDPDYIVCWGRVAAENLLGTKEAIGKLRKRFFTYGRAKVAVTYHPSYLLRNPPAKKDVWDDMKWLFRDMGVDLDAGRKGEAGDRERG
ncbi:MAG: uracil-DNA glycosylase [Planctomycetaceae bacterium]|nr:uracil-DNA glycosylase [Planctomycetaceae bacterium]